MFSGSFFHISGNVSFSLQDWRFKALDKIDQSNVQLLNEVEGIALRNEKYYYSFDYFAAAAFLFPSIIRSIKPYNATVELAGQLTRGEMITDPQSTDYNVNIIRRISGKQFKLIMLYTAYYWLNLLKNSAPKTKTPALL